MSQKKGIPSGDVVFNVVFNQLMGALGLADATSNAPAVISWTRLGMDNVTQFAVLTSLLVRWNKVYPLQRSKATRNGTTRLEKNTVKKAALAILRPFRTIIIAKDKLTPGFLTTQDNKLWYIDTRASITFQKAPEHAPIVAVESNEHLLHLLRVSDPNTPGSKSKADGASHIEVRRFIAEKGLQPPADLDQWTMIALSGSVHIVSHFEVDDVGKFAHYYVRYRGNHNSVGATSEVVSSVII